MNLLLTESQDAKLAHVHDSRSNVAHKERIKRSKAVLGRCSFSVLVGHAGCQYLNSSWRRSLRTTIHYPKGALKSSKVHLKISPSPRVQHCNEDTDAGRGAPTPVHSHFTTAWPPDAGPRGSSA